jgi:serine/threonine-protein kinase
MGLTSGARLGPYEILAAIGAGGMGEVYKARDTRLDRIVAIKVLPEQLAADQQFRDRFDREARAVSALDHPHICALYDVGDQDGTAFLVMQYLEGQTLEARLSAGALPVEQALDYAIQIAGALAAAHKAGIVHRDLKPGNVMLTKAGAKLLDFGLAKTALTVPGGSLSMLPTTPAVTAQGTILGTFQYMAPEQLEGHEADTRTDIFAFGVVVYEMLTGKKAFAGKSQASLIGAIMHADPPPMSTLQPLTPATLDRSIRKCLAKAPDDRWQSAKDLLDALKWTDESVPVRREQSARPYVWAAGGALIAAVMAAAVTWILTRPAPAPARQVSRFTITLAGGLQLQNPGRPLVALSPDGTHLVYAVGEEGGNQRLYLRALDQLEAAPLRGTERASWPFFSPDGQWIAFWQGGQIKKMSISGGAPVAVCAAAALNGATWSTDDTIVFVEGSDDIRRVQGTGGSSERLLKLEAGQAYGPQVLPGGRALLFTLNDTGARWDAAQVVVVSLDTGKRQVVLQGGYDAKYLPTGHLAYINTNTLLAAPFDVAALKVTGGPVPLVERVRAGTGGVSSVAHYSISRTGSLVYVPADTLVQRTLAWVDRQGHEEALPAEPRPYRYPRVSPDGSRVAIEAQDQDNDIWIWEFARATLTRLTFTPENELSPLWTPDGQRVVFQTQRPRASNVYQQAANGTGAIERLTTGPNRQLPDAFTPDGKALVYSEIDAKGNYDIFLQSLDGNRASKPLLNTPFNEQNADLSPDGRWMVYQSNQSGQDEVYVRPFPRVDDGRWQISVGGGSRPVWARNGRELFYLGPVGAMMTAAVQSQTSFSAGSPTKLFEGSSYGWTLTVGRHYDVAPDARRFLMIKQPSGRSEADRLIVVENWFEELKARVPTKK